MAIDLESLSVIEFVRIIQKRPLNWLHGGITLTGLHNVLVGFQINCKKKDHFCYFSDYVCFRLKSAHSNLSYHYWILEHCEGDEEKGFYTFFELLDEFERVLLVPPTIWRADLSEDNFEFYYSRKHTDKPYGFTGTEKRKILYPAPYRIELEEYAFATYVSYYDFYQMMERSSCKSIFHSSFLNVTEAKARKKELYGSLVWKKKGVE